MARIKYRVAVMGLLTLAGMVNFGDEVTEDMVADIDALVKSGHLATDKDFKNAEAESEADQKKADKTNKVVKDVAGSNPLADALKELEKAKAAYKEKYNLDAPETADLKSVNEAIKSGKPFDEGEDLK